MGKENILSNPYCHTAEKSSNMKYSIAILLTIIACASTCVINQTYRPVADDVIPEELNLNMHEFSELCETHTGLVKDLTKDRAIATKIAYVLSDKLAMGAKKSPRIDDKSWDQLIKDYCLEDVVLQTFNKSNVDDINLCLDEEDKLRGEDKIDFANVLLEAYCGEVKRLAKEKYAACKN